MCPTVRYDVLPTGTSLPETVRRVGREVCECSPQYRPEVTEVLPCALNEKCEQVTFNMCVKHLHKDPV